MHGVLIYAPSPVLCYDLWSCGTFLYPLYIWTRRHEKIGIFRFSSSPRRHKGGGGKKKELELDKKKEKK